MTNDQIPITKGTIIIELFVFLEIVIWYLIIIFLFGICDLLFGYYLLSRYLSNQSKARLMTLSL
jgi:hypothetical protein